MGNRHELLESTSVFQGRFLEMLVDRIRLPDGEESVREWVRHPGAAAVVAMEGGRVLLVRQNRHAVGENLLEVPAGKLDPAGEDPEV
ncbi:MAG: NUDIX domain-containing protein, partial [Acidimicrobiales bacterium]